MDESDHLSLGYKNLDGAQREEDTDPVMTTSTRPMKRTCNNKKLGWAMQRTRSDSSVKVSSNGASKASNHYHRPPRPPQTIVTALARLEHYFLPQRIFHIFRISTINE